MESKKRNIFLILSITLLISVIGITYAFFNYTRTGSENKIRT